MEDEVDKESGMGKIVDGICAANGPGDGNCLVGKIGRNWVILWLWPSFEVSLCVSSADIPSRSGPGNAQTVTTGIPWLKQR